MVKTSTLVYLMDDITQPADMFLLPDRKNVINDEYYLKLLDLLETDPGSEIVNRILVKENIKGAV